MCCFLNLEEVKKIPISALLENHYLLVSLCDKILAKLLEIVAAFVELISGSNLARDLQ